MKKQEIVGLLKGIPFFEDFKDEELDSLIAFESHILKFTDGDVIVAQGEISKEFFILLEGQAHITKREVPKSILNTLRHGELFGEVPVITGAPRLTNVIAKGDVSVLKIDHFLMDKLPPEVTIKFLSGIIRILVRRLDEMNSAMAGLKSEFENFSTAYDHVRRGIDQIIQTSNDLKIVQNLSYSYFNKMRA